MSHVIPPEHGSWLVKMLTEINNLLTHANELQEENHAEVARLLQEISDKLKDKGK